MDDANSISISPSKLIIINEVSSDYRPIDSRRECTHSANVLLMYSNGLTNSLSQKYLFLKLKLMFAFVLLFDSITYLSFLCSELVTPTKH